MADIIITENGVMEIPATPLGRFARGIKRKLEGFNLVCSIQPAKECFILSIVKAGRNVGCVLVSQHSHSDPEFKLSNFSGMLGIPRWERTLQELEYDYNLIVKAERSKESRQGS